MLYLYCLYLRLKLLFTSSLTSLLANDLTDIADTFTLVWLGLAQTADLRGHLAYQLLVVTFQGDHGILSLLLGSSQLQLLGDLEDDVVRVTQRQVQDIALVGSFETYTYQLQFPLIAIGNALHHVGYQGAIKAMQGTVTDLVRGTAELQLAFLHFYLDITVDGLLQFPLGTLYYQEIIRSYSDGHSLGKHYRFLTYTRHNFTFLLPTPAGREPVIYFILTIPAGQPYLVFRAASSELNASRQTVS